MQNLCNNASGNKSLRGMNVSGTGFSIFLLKKKNSIQDTDIFFISPEMNPDIKTVHHTLLPNRFIKWKKL